MQVAVGGTLGRRGALGSLCLVLVLGGAFRPADVRAPAPRAPLAGGVPSTVPRSPATASAVGQVVAWGTRAPSSTSPLLSPRTLAVWQSVPGGPAMARLPDTALTSTCGPLDPPVPGGAIACSPMARAIVVDPARRFQTIAGFGGAFNERGWLALLTLSATARSAVLRALFDPRQGRATVWRARRSGPATMPSMPTRSTTSPATRRFGASASPAIASGCSPTSRRPARWHPISRSGPAPGAPRPG